MTFEQFQASGRDVDDVGPIIQDEGYMGIPGRIYVGFLNIERMPDGTWSTVINNRETAGNLVDCERALYEFAISEGIEVR
jgi:hypothetical protein